ncbi:hypothetical protein [Bacillus mobilis]|uniref:hypothetical protein n=1 Tax=Bacillus mobilis TaxID=2026190 RepID=UPI000A3022FB|nr:hypothetical protein [Bacillus mobilis]MCU5594801.1 hypothetical protein [Bacillus mobilis]MCU5738088.1 hypothetical protein [Bacillus mobilis]MCU9561697.1 hypothetical protein [Bacillus mobilis]SMD95202.1 hypothetical protein BACERE00177_01619 [Bacillus mobilis]HDR7517150.1 hypothetical protein [Bacillus mobilis]
MKLQLAVSSEIFMDIFLDDALDPERRERKRRIHYHKLLMNKQLEEKLEVKAKELGVGELFQNWFVQVSYTAENIQFEEESEETEELAVLIDLANSSDHKIVVCDVERSSIFQNKIIRFCTAETFGKSNDDFIKMDHLIELEREGSVVKNLFSLFETPIELDVSQNKPSLSLAKYLSSFYDEEEIVIQDLYFVSNENNFKDYILPYIPEGCKRTIIIPKSAGATHKKRIEQKYKATVKCYDDINMHESYILTKNYKIKLGYRLDLFGSNGKTKKETVHIRKRKD